MYLKRVILCVLYLFPYSACPWGFYGHQQINKIAVYTLPPELLGLFKRNLNSIIETSVKPDMRRYAVADEGMRHFIDIDHYEHVLPLDTLPSAWDDALGKYGMDTLSAHGIGPWHVVRMKGWLTRAFADKNAENVLRIASELGHYIADLHVPLHTTSNYNGQLTGQHGIHGLWESRIPELFFEEYDLFVDSAIYITDVGEYIWKQVAISHSLVDSVLSLEEKATSETSSSDKYSYGARGSRVVKHYSEQFCAVYNTYLDRMVERRLRDAIFSVGSVWYTAWVDAGQPEIDWDDDGKNDHSAGLRNDSLKNTRVMIGRPEIP